MNLKEMIIKNSGLNEEKLSKEKYDDLPHSSSYNNYKDYLKAMLKHFNKKTFGDLSKKEKTLIDAGWKSDKEKKGKS
ncbi:MAG: hypothetical protein ACOC3V_00980 [bacterium]